MGFVSKQYLQTQFTNFATRISAVFAKKNETNNSFSGYETGTWTPKHGYTAVSTQLLLTNGEYTKIGNIVVARCKVAPGAKDGGYNIYISKTSTPFTMKHFILATLQAPYDGKKTDGVMVGAVGSVYFGSKTFSQSNSEVTTYYATIMYAI